MTMQDVEFIYDKKQYFQTIPLREIEVHDDKDTDPNKPIPSIHEIIIKNNTPNTLDNLLVETNLPKGTWEIMDLPDFIPPHSEKLMRMAIYGRIMFQKREEVPDEIKLNILYNERMKRL
jgi:hypothetical protein